MPTYQYKCDQCDQVGKFFHKMSEDPEYFCPDCDQKLRRLIGKGGGVIFKGSGFYATDYRKIEQAQKHYNTPRKESEWSQIGYEATANWERRVVAHEEHKRKATGDSKNT